MGLLNTCTDVNKVIHQGKTVSYSVRRIYGSWCYGSGPTIAWKTQAWEYHRYCTCSYSYVGLDKDTATTYALDRISKYTRAIKYSQWDSTNGVFEPKEGGSACMAEINARPTQGNMWQIDITVREDDVRVSLTHQEASSFFTTENNRNYDGL